MLKKTVTCLMLIIPSLLYAKNSFLVAPTSAEISMKKPTTVSFIVTNSGDNTIRITATPIYFELGSKFMPPLKPLDAKSPVNDDITPYMIVSPKVVSVKPGDQRTVRVSVRPKGDQIMDGEYRGHVLFSMMEVASTVGQKAKKKGEGTSMVINFKSETAVVVYGSRGKGEPELKTTCSLSNKGNLKVNIANAGKWRFDGWMRIHENNDTTSKKLVDEKIFITRESVKESLLNWKPGELKGPINISWVPLDETKKTFNTQCNI